MSDQAITATPPVSAWPDLANGRAIWTGHQPRFWHPGILAKYVAADAALRAAGDPDTPLHHVVVDQDVQDPLALDLPVRRGDVLSVASVRLGPVRRDVPTGRQPAAVVHEPELPPGTDPRAAHGIAQITAALRHAQSAATLAQQVTAALASLLKPHLTRPLAPHFATGLFAAPAAPDGSSDLVHQLLHDAERCVALYNRAAAQDPGAGIAPMQREPFRVELPLWHLPWNAPRQRVYADLADTRPLLTAEDGHPLSGDAPLAPRALLMTAWIRRPDAVTPGCGLFIHGTGGGRYDRITEAWWTAWRREALAPIAVATADQRLAFDAPVHTAADHRHAVWYAHHLPHNPDRLPGLAGPRAQERGQERVQERVQEKRALLAAMDDDRHKPRRRAAFERIKQINAELCRHAPNALEDARAHVARTRQGLANAGVAHRRDWPFVYFSG